MNTATMRMRNPTRDRFVGAARPHTPRLHSPLLWADAPRETPPEGNAHPYGQGTRASLPTGAVPTIGQLYLERYSLRLGGSLFDDHLAHFCVSVSTVVQTRRFSEPRLCGEPHGVGCGEGAEWWWIDRDACGARRTWISLVRAKKRARASPTPLCGPVRAPLASSCGCSGP